MTENAKDFVPIVNEWMAEGREHFGLILTASEAISRHRNRFIGATVTALTATLEAHPAHGASSAMLWL